MRKKTVMPRCVKKPARVLTEPQKQVMKYCQEWIAKTQLKQIHSLFEFNTLLGENLDEQGCDYSDPKAIADDIIKSSQSQNKMPKSIAIRKVKQDAKEQLEKQNKMPRSKEDNRREIF